MQILADNRFVRSLIALCAALLIGLIILGFTGRYMAAGDSLALLRPQAGALLIVFTLFLMLVRAKRFALVSLVFAVVAFGSIASGYGSASDDCDDTCLTLYQKNLMTKAWPRYPLADDILESGAQIVTLQEVSSHNRKYMSNLFEHYPTSVSCQFRPEQSVAVLSDLPAVDGSEFCLPGYGVVGLQLETPNGDPVWVVSIHMAWPFPYNQFEQSQKIADYIKNLDGPVLIAGDFNMVPWGGSVTRIRMAADNQNFGTLLNTHSLGSWIMPMPIDNLLFPKGTTGSVETRPYMGSDHLGVLARIQLP
ncbi:MAG: endonuclease/exonuclease/phosphatase family protein [Ruegeria sp.]